MTQTLSFEEALYGLKKGHKIARSGWNGKNMWLLLITDWSIDSKHTADVVGLLPLPFIAMRTATMDFVPWLASQTDLLSEDWVLLDE